MAPGAFSVDRLDAYLARTREHFVIVDPSERRAAIEEQTEQAAAAVGGKVLRNEELLETVTFLTEYPTVVCGSFDGEFLKLPREGPHHDDDVTSEILSRRRSQWRPSALVPDDQQYPGPRSCGRKTGGNERVIRARLSDARFFFEEDRKIPWRGVSRTSGRSSSTPSWAPPTTK